MKKIANILLITMLVAVFSNFIYAGDDPVPIPDSNPNPPIYTPFGDDPVPIPD